MKNKIVLGSTIVAGSLALVLTGCKKDDTTAPVITLNGSSTVNVSLNSAYVDLGATATDEKDGNLTSSITVTNPVNKDLTGTYTVTYSVSDAAGNSSTATRSVVVANDAAAMAGTYATVTVYDGTTLLQSRTSNSCSAASANTFSDVVTASTTVNNQLSIARFGGYVFGTGSTAIKFTVTGTTLTVASQGTTNIGCPTITGSTSFSGTGTKTTTGFTLTWTETNPSGTQFPNQNATYVK